MIIHVFSHYYYYYSYNLFPSCDDTLCNVVSSDAGKYLHWNSRTRSRPTLHRTVDRGRHAVPDAHLKFNEPATKAPSTGVKAFTVFSEGGGVPELPYIQQHPYSRSFSRVNNLAVRSRRWSASGVLWHDRKIGVANPRSGWPSARHVPGRAL